MTNILILIFDIQQINQKFYVALVETFKADPKFWDWDFVFNKIYSNMLPLPLRDSEGLQ